MRVHQLAHAILPSDFPIGTPHGSGATFPVPSTSRIGRRDEIEYLEPAPAVEVGA